MINSEEQIGVWSWDQTMLKRFTDVNGVAVEQGGIRAK